MATVTSLQIKELRTLTDAPIMECKKALEQAGGDIHEAIKILRTAGMAALAKKSLREAKEGLIGIYTHHNGKLGVLVELNCETDFAARTMEFQQLSKDIAMQIAAAQPLYIQRNDIPPQIISQEKEVYLQQARRSGKPEHICEKMMNGRLEKYFKDVCLLEQPFIKDPNITVSDLIVSVVTKIRENVVVSRFSRYEIGK